MLKPAIAAVLAVYSCTALASDLDVKNVEHISVFAHRQAMAQPNVLASISVLEHVDIMARQANDLPELLAQLVGVNLARDGGRGQNASLYIRGGNTGHTLVLIDGVRVGTATLGYKSLAMMPLELIERIELIRGPRAAFYGADALAGVIAISTRRSQTVAINGNIASYGQMGADISISHTLDNLSLWATVGVNQADGFNIRPDLDPDNDGYKQKFIKLSADYHSRLGLWQLKTDVNSGRYQFDSAWSEQDQSDTLTRSHQLGWQQQFGQWQHQVQLSQSLDNDTPFSANSRSAFITQREEFSYQTLGHINSELTLLAGLNWYQEDVAKSATAYEQTQRNNKAVFTGINYQYQGLHLDLTARRDVFRQYGAENTWQFAAGYQVSQHWQLRASRGTAFKVPSFNALYYPGYANPDLKPEQARSDEIGLRYHKPQFQLELSWFNRDVTNLIQGVEQAQNVKLAAISGIELSLVKQWQQVSTELAYTWLDAKNRSTGTQLERRPENTLHWRSSYQGDTWSLFITADHQTGTYQGIYSAVENLPSFTLWGLGASYQLNTNLVIRSAVKNMFDKQYQTSAGYATAGANINLSLSYRL
ncbi:TonB-dependent receptor domain-containing protein [Rheinheimera sp. WS51]|uniref:TonB-dependent receptor domain-containing protein n=1 Tax=Rheinheimera sp. WS51 TaxID=3425886 RepID=UPI003D89E490